jgi:hypothetical protein
MNPKRTRSDPTMEATMTPTAEPTIKKTRKAQGRTSTKADRQKDDGRVKATIVMDRKLHCLLSSIATFQDMDGSELAALLIDRGLKERHRELYDALYVFEPKVAKRAKPDAQGTEKESAIGDADVNPPALAID